MKPGMTMGMALFMGLVGLNGRAAEVVTNQSTEEGGVLVSEAARTSIPKGSFSLSGDLVLRANPLGAILFTGLGYRLPYRFDAVRGVDSSVLQAGFGLAVNGAFVQGGPFVEWMPILPVQLRAQYDLYGFTGTNGSLLSFPTAVSAFGDDAIAARAGQEERTHAQRLLLRPTLRMKFGRMVLRNQTDLALYRISGRGPYYFEREYDTLLKATDGLVSNRLGLLVVILPGKQAPGFALGPAYEVTHALGAGLTRQRIGLQGSYIPDSRAGTFSGVRLYGMAGLNLQDPNRENGFFITMGVGTDLNL